MNKIDLINALNNKFDITMAEAAKVVSAFFDEMAETPANGDRV